MSHTFMALSVVGSAPESIVDTPQKRSGAPDSAMRSGAMVDTSSIKLPLVDKHRERYAGWIANNICDGVFNGFRGVRSVILVGGGADMVEGWLREWYGEKIVDRKKLPHTRKIPPVDMNAMGGLRLELMRQRQSSG